MDQEPVPEERCLPTHGGCLCIFVAVIIAIGVILLTVSCYSSNPRDPKFGVESASLYSLSNNYSKLPGKWNIDLTVTNPNKWNEISYDTVSIRIIYNGDHNQSILASNSNCLAPFSQKVDSSVNKKVELNMDVQHDVETERSFSSGTVNFKIEMSTSVRFKGYINFSRNCSLKVVCNPLTIRLSPTSSIWVLQQRLICESQRSLVGSHG